MRAFFVVRQVGEKPGQLGATTSNRRDGGTAGFALQKLRLCSSSQRRRDNPHAPAIRKKGLRGFASL